MSDDPPQEPDAGPDQAKPGTSSALARVSDGLARRHLDAALADQLMAGADSGLAISRELDSLTGLAMPTLADIEQVATERPVSSHESLAQIEALLSLDRIGDLADESSRLNALLDRGGASIEERKILRSGMLFLRRRMYREADEWWLLNRPADQNAPFHLLLELLQVLTCKLAGDEDRALALLTRLKPRLRRP